MRLFFVIERRAVLLIPLERKYEETECVKVGSEIGEDW